MNKGLTFNIGKTSFNTTLLVDNNDGVIIDIDDIWTTEDDIYTELDFTLNVRIYNYSTSSKSVYVKIYSDEEGYGGTTSPYTISSNGNNVFSLTDFMSTSGLWTIRVEAWSGNVNYESSDITIFISSSNSRILTTGEERQLTDSDIRVVV